MQILLLELCEAVAVDERGALVDDRAHHHIVLDEGHILAESLEEFLQPRRGLLLIAFEL